MKKAIKITLNVLAWILLIFALLITILVFSSSRNNGVSNLFGFIPMTVESASMEPTFKVDDLIICKEVDDIYTLQEGDVITFWTIIEGKRVKNTHRIVGINEAENSRSFVTRGDNNGMDDDMPAYAGDIIGKWTGTKLPGFGKVVRFLSTKTGFFCCIIIPMALFFLFELYKFIATLMEIRKPKLTVSDEEEIKRRAIEEYLASQNAQNGGTPAPEAPAPEAPAASEAVTETPADTAPAPETPAPAEPAPAEAAPAEETTETPTDPDTDK
ncbi:MAG: signal peptidase I [Ruminococcus sp.]|nr:signal peptidase I [Ruminococcus sp.]